MLLTIGFLLMVVGFFVALLRESHYEYGITAVVLGGAVIILGMVIKELQTPIDAFLLKKRKQL